MPTREQELAQLIAEQEKDARTGDRVYSASLDAELSEDGGKTGVDLLAAEPTGLPGSEALPRSGRNSLASDARHGTNYGYCRGCRCERCVKASRTYEAERRQRAPSNRVKHGTLTMYAHHRCRCDSCAGAKAIYEKIARLKKSGRRKNLALLDRLRAAAEDYVAGARIIDVATAIYKDVGYSSPESCYQQLRVLFHRVGVPVRPQSWKHGHRMRAATEEEYRAYWRAHNRRVTERHRATLKKCPAITKTGTRCRRYTISGSEFCVNHGGNRRPEKWPRERVLAAIRNYTTEHGRKPVARDWMRATDSHPSFKTVYDLFGSWPVAIDEALSPDRERAS